MLLPIIRSVFPDSAVYHLYSLGILIISIAVAIIFFLWLYRHQQEFQQQSQKSKISFRLLLSAHTREFYLIYGLSALASSIPAVLVLFFIRDHLGVENMTGLFLLLYFVAAFSGIPFWRKISERKTKPVAWLAAMVLACLSFVCAYFLEQGDVIAYGLICLISGFAFGAELVLPPSILSDLIDKKGHQQQTSAYFSILAFLTKLSLSLASGISLILLGQTDFLPAVQNSGKSLLMLNIAYAVFPCAIKLISIAVLIYWIRKEDRNEIQINSSPDRITYHA